MNAAYSAIIESDSFNVESALALTDFDNQNSFGKRFKELYQMTPREAYRCKDRTKLEEPLSWDNILSPKASTGESIIGTSTCFGVTHEEYRLIQEAQDKQAEYGLTDDEANLAFELFKKYKPAKMDIAFDFVKCVQWVALCSNPSLTAPSIEEVKAVAFEDMSITERCFKEDISYEDAISEKEAEKFIPELELAYQEYAVHSDNPYAKQLLSDRKSIAACQYLDFSIYLFQAGKEYLFADVNAVFFELYRISKEMGNEDFDGFLQYEYAGYLYEKGYIDEEKGKIKEDFNWRDSIEDFEKQVKAQIA